MKKNKVTKRKFALVSMTVSRHREALKVCCALFSKKMELDRSLLSLGITGVRGRAVSFGPLGLMLYIQ